MSEEVRLAGILGRGMDMNSELKADVKNHIGVHNSTAARLGIHVNQCENVCKVSACQGTLALSVGSRMAIILYRFSGSSRLCFLP